MNMEVSKNIETLSPRNLEKQSGCITSFDRPFLNAAVDGFGRNLREFGIKECTAAAKEIFTPDVLEKWAKMNPEQRLALAQEYGSRVAESFDLADYKGVIFEKMEGMNGFNRGDGIAHLNSDFLNDLSSPLQMVDTITHELRHQYQVECVRGYHYIPEETKKEWAIGTQIYTNTSPWAFDPWGYKYNPLETDARYAGESVVREFTKDFINGNFA